MGTAKLIEKLEDFFDLSRKKQRKRHDKLERIIDKLEKKQRKLERELEQARKKGSDSEAYHELIREMDVISDLIRKAKDKENAD